MRLGIQSPWRAAKLAPELPGHMGVFELADDAGRVVYIGFAGGRSRYGLRSEIAAALVQPELEGPAVPTQFRFEVTTAYLTRYQELVMAHQALRDAAPDAGPMPQYSTGQPAGSIRFGRLAAGDP